MVAPVAAVRRRCRSRVRCSWSRLPNAEVEGTRWCPRCFVRADGTGVTRVGEKRQRPSVVSRFVEQLSRRRGGRTERGERSGVGERLEVTGVPREREQAGGSERGIVIDGVSRSFGEVRAVRDVTLRAGPGEIVGLLGPNGAGKTTLLRMVATLLRPDAGTIRVEGRDTVEEPLAVRSVLGYQTGDTGLYERLTAREFLEFFGALHGLSREECAERAARVLERLEATAFADRLCEKLSTGQKQRVVLARTLVARPPVLVLDEPTSGLDLRASSFILEALREAAGEGRAVIFSTHQMAEVEILCDRVVVLHEGAVVATGTVGSLCEQTSTARLAEAFLALTGAPLQGEDA
ncbi:MAG: heme ABC exporter ATP-binding protein CcmA [Deltaproteobacteria bacterium]|nr:MAG: heme ABC exporter ATP-binding protein CcmA [Deltaproteobacteria bacterium]